MVAIKGHFDGKVFVPEEPVNLPSGQPVTMYVTPATPSASPGGGPSEHPLDWIADNLGIDDPSLPTDGSVQHDHYLYGSPKRSPSE
jgi:hypothetical protein